MEGSHHHHHQQHPQQPHQISVNIDTGDRFPQWSIQETRDFLMIRAELDPTFMETKRNKPLWEVIAAKMKEKGYNRSAEQCKCKWKNLVTRYKGCETMEPEGMRQQFQFPFYNELQTIFAARMQRMLWIEAEGGGGGASGSKKKGVSSDDDDDNEESEGEKGGSKKKRKVAKVGPTNNPSSSGNINGLKEVIEEFMKQQMQMEMQWIKANEAREEERRMKEMEWRQTMESLENERLIMDRRMREREEQRRVREEARAEKRDALITTLLNKYRREDM